MRIEQVVGMRIKQSREADDMTQEQFGQKLGELLGRPWSRQAVSAAERGGRAFTAAELVAASHVLSTSAGWLMTPPTREEVIELGTTPDGEALTLPRHEVVNAILPFDSTDASINRVNDWADAFQGMINQVQGAVQYGDMVMAEMRAALDQAIESGARRGRSELPTD